MGVLREKLVGAHSWLATVDIDDSVDDRGAEVSEYAVMTGMGITIAGLAGALLWTIVQTIINGIPDTVQYPG